MYIYVYVYFRYDGIVNLLHNVSLLYIVILKMIDLPDHFRTSVEKHAYNVFCFRTLSIFTSVGFQLI